MRSTPALIIGGGPAGSAAAIVLAEAGIKPLVLERSDGIRDVVCGGFLSWDALASLDRIGIDAGALGAHRIKALRLLVGERSADFELPFPAAGISRRTLDAALIAHAAGRGARIERGVTVRTFDAATRTAKLADGESITGDAVFLATGKHELRGARRETGARSDMAVGLRLRLQATPAMSRALDHHIELYLYDHGYAGLLLQEDGSANLCLTIARSRFVACGSQPDQILAELARENPRFGERIGQSATASSWSSVARVPYGWIARRTENGLFRVGDQAAVIPSIVGDGVAIALASGRQSAAHFINGGAAAAPQFQRDLASSLFWPMLVARGLRVTGEHPRFAAAAVPIMDKFPSIVRALSRFTRIGGY